MPELLKALMTLSEAPGSGKFGTPCERMHLEYLRGSPLEVEHSTGRCPQPAPFGREGRGAEPCDARIGRAAPASGGGQGEANDSGGNK